jgi:hypothetical protein
MLVGTRPSVYWSFVVSIRAGSAPAALDHQVVEGPWLRPSLRIRSGHSTAWGLVG